ncbi:hypothetical protein QL285_054702 [Trifolium repens]|nr:hypothetical protein QL285_054702 [Trifolium repens]
MRFVTTQLPILVLFSHTHHLTSLSAASAMFTVSPDTLFHVIWDCYLYEVGLRNHRTGYGNHLFLVIGLCGTQLF